MLLLLAQSSLMALDCTLSVVILALNPRKSGRIANKGYDLLLYIPASNPESPKKNSVKLTNINNIM